MKNLRIVHTASKNIITDGPLTQYFELGKYLFFPKDSARFHVLKAAKGVKFGPRLGFYGPQLIETNSATKIGTGIFQIALPSPFGLFLRKYFFIEKRDPQFTLEISDYASPLNPLSVAEGELRGGPGDIKTLERIGNLVKEHMTIIDHRDNGKSLLLKNKSDKRLFQLLVEGESIDKPEAMILAEVTHQQWAYLYLEQRERKKKGEMPLNPTDYLDSLDEDKPYRKCEVCDQGAVKYSSLCKSHHFEAVMGHQPNT